jgi:hypothetical protein
MNVLDRATVAGLLTVIFVEMSSLLKSNGIYLLTQFSVTLCPPVVKGGRIVQLSVTPLPAHINFPCVAISPAITL